MRKTRGQRADRIVSWGMGGPDHTLTGLTSEEEREAMDMFRAWGPVRIRHDPGDVPRWASNGHPLPEGNLTREFLLSARRARQARQRPGRAAASSRAGRRSG